MMGGFLRSAFGVGISLLLLAGCGHGSGASAPATSSTPPTPSVDVATLDTGKYLTLPRRLGQVVSEDEGRTAEAIRMTEAVADPTSIDPALIERDIDIPVITPEAVAKNISGTGDAVVAPVLAKYQMVTGCLQVASNVKIDQSGSARSDQDLTSVILLVVRFPDAASASGAAVEMDAADFAASPDNVPVPITKYPAAHGHWRPNFPSMASTLAHGDFVVHVVGANPTPNLEALTGLVEKAFDQETSALDRFQPTPVDQIAKLPKDPEGLLGRMVDLSPGTEPTLSVAVGSYGPNGAKRFQNEQQAKDKVFDNDGVDQLAVWIDPKVGGAIIFRLRDRDAAGKFLESAVSTDDAIDHPIDGVRGLPDAKCFEQKAATYQDSPSSRFECYVRYDRYVGNVYSGGEADVRQEAAAQYALLANP